MSIVLKLSAKKGNPPRRGIDFYWALIQGFQAADQTFTSRQLHSVSDGRHSDVRDFLRRLVKAGFVEITDDVAHSAFGPAGPVYRALVRQSATPKIRRDGTVIEGASAQKCIWNTIRSSVCNLGFTAQDVVTWGSTDELKLNRTAVMSYLQVLSRAGYLIQLDKGGPGKLATWRLDPAMNTGPLPPMILRAKVVFDQNRHEVVTPEVEAEEVSP